MNIVEHLATKKANISPQELVETKTELLLQHLQHILVPGILTRLIANHSQNNKKTRVLPATGVPDLRHSFCSLFDFCFHGVHKLRTPKKRSCVCLTRASVLTLLLFITLCLTSSFTAVIISTATRGRPLTEHINMVCNSRYRGRFWWGWTGYLLVDRYWIAVC